MPRVRPSWSARLAAARRAVRIPQRTLAERTSISLDALRKYESGARHPSRPHLAALLDAIGAERAERNRILHEAGYAADGHTEGYQHPPGMFSTEEVAAEVHKYRWPAYAIDEFARVIDANAVAQRLWGVDLSREFLHPAERNLLSVASDPRFADRCVNWDEVITLLVGVFKAKDWTQESVEEPSPYFKAVLEHFLKGDPKYVAKFAELWQKAPEIWDQKCRWSFPLVWNQPGIGEMRFEYMAYVANHADGTNFNDWIPADAATWDALERLMAGA